MWIVDPIHSVWEGEKKLLKTLFHVIHQHIYRSNVPDALLLEEEKCDRTNHSITQLNWLVVYYGKWANTRWVTYTRELRWSWFIWGHFISYPKDAMDKFYITFTITILQFYNFYERFQTRFSNKIMAKKKDKQTLNGFGMRHLWLWYVNIYINKFLCEPVDGRHSLNTRHSG